MCPLPAPDALHNVKSIYNLQYLIFSLCWRLVFSRGRLHLQKEKLKMEVYSGRWDILHSYNPGTQKYHTMQEVVGWVGRLVYRVGVNPPRAVIKNVVRICIPKMRE